MGHRVHRDHKVHRDQWDRSGRQVRKGNKGRKARLDRVYRGQWGRRDREGIKESQVFKVRPVQRVLGAARRGLLAQPDRRATPDLLAQMVRKACLDRRVRKVIRGLPGQRDRRAPGFPTR